MKNYYFEHLSVDNNLATEALISGLKIRLELCRFLHTDEFCDEILKCINNTIRLLNHMDDYHVEQWIDAAKRHKDKMAKIMTEIIQISKDNAIPNPVAKVSRSRIEFYDGFEIQESSIQPRSFWVYYKLFKFIAFCENSDQLIAVQSIITTIFTLYKDIRVMGPLLDKAVRKHLDEMSDNSLQRSAKTHLLDDVHNFLNHIDECVLNGATPRSKSAKSVVATILLIKKKEVDMKVKLSNDNLPKSMKSTGTSVKGVGTLPGILASAFESDCNDYDYSQFDELVGYKRDPALPLSSLRTNVTRCVAIPHRSKADARLIHTGCNAIQDRLHFAAETMKIFLKFRYSIAVWDQMKAVRRIQSWFERGSKAIYSLDLHSATDTLDRFQQAEVYKHLLRWFEYTEDEISILVSQWLHDMSRLVHITLPFSHEHIAIDMITGQPMGLESSVYSLNLSHDLWSSALEDKVEIENSIQSEGHEILGDDFCIAFKEDKDYIFPEMYKNLMAELNCECNLQKGYQYNIHRRELSVPLAEFAKNLICGGYNITALPLGCLFKCDTCQGKLTLLSWIKDRMTDVNRLPIDSVLDCLPQRYKTLGVILSASPVNNILTSLVWGEKKPVFRSQDVKISLISGLAYLSESIVLKVLCEMNNDPDYIPVSSDYSHFIKKWRHFARIVVDHRDLVPNNKLIAEFDKLELVAIAQGIVVERVVKNLSLLTDNDSDLLDLIPTLQTLGDVSSESFLNFLDMINLDFKEENPALWTVPKMNSLMEDLRKIFNADFNSPAHRYGNAEDKLALGMDFERLENSIKKYFSSFDITEENLQSFYEYVKEISGSVDHGWMTTEMIDWSSRMEEEEEDQPTEFEEFLEDLLKG